MEFMFVNKSVKERITGIENNTDMITLLQIMLVSSLLYLSLLPTIHTYQYRY